MISKKIVLAVIVAGGLSAAALAAPALTVKPVATQATLKVEPAAPGSVHLQVVPVQVTVDGRDLQGSLYAR